MRRTIQIFVSYVPEDELAVRNLCEELSVNGFAVLPKREIGDGDLKTSQPLDGNEKHKVDFFLVCLSTKSVDSRGRLQSEMRRDLADLWQRTDSDAFLIPIRLDECRVPENLRAFEPIDVFVKDGLSGLIEVIWEVNASRTQLREGFPESANARTSEMDGDTLEGPLDPNSIPQWGVDLRRLLTGEREDSLLRLGGVEEYIEVMLAEAEDIPVAQQAFTQALEQLIQTWHPSTLEDDLQVRRTLDLVSAYTPRGGFVKVIALMQGLKRIAKSNGQDAYSVDDDLCLKAFVTLENYYPTAPKSPEDRSAAYQTYIELLREDLSNPAYCGYALKRLVELRVMELGSDEVEYLIETNPTNLVTLVGLILDPSRYSKTQEELALVYNRCLSAGFDIEEQFGRAVIRCGGRIERTFEAGPIVHFRATDFIIELDDVSKYYYSEMILRREEAEGKKKMQALTAHV
jgi:hypothetical protein